MEKYNLNYLAFNHSFVYVDLIFGTCSIHKSGLVELFEQCSNSIGVASIARLLAQEIVVGFLVENKSLVLLLEKNLTL